MADTDKVADPPANATTTETVIECPCCKALLVSRVVLWQENLGFQTRAYAQASIRPALPTK